MSVGLRLRNPGQRQPDAWVGSDQISPCDLQSSPVKRKRIQPASRILREKGRLHTCVPCDSLIRFILLVLAIQIFSTRLSFRFTGKLKRRFGDLPYSTCPHTFLVSPIIISAHHGDTLIVTDEPPLTRHCHPEPMGSIRAYSWCCTFPGSEQIL